MNYSNSKEKTTGFIPNPTVEERTSDGTRTYDIYSRLLKDRIVMLKDEVCEDSINPVIAQLLFLNNEDPEKPIYLYIDSPGGSVMAGLALVDIMHFISAPVYTICLGTAASMGAVILSAGEKGHRYALPCSSILVHPMSGGTKGRTNDSIVEINFEKRLQNLLMARLGYNCGQISKESYEEIKDAIEMMDDDRNEYPDFKVSKNAQKELEKFKKDNNYDHWMFPKKAIQFGIIDEILTNEIREDE